MKLIHLQGVADFGFAVLFKQDHPADFSCLRFLSFKIQHDMLQECQDTLAAVDLVLSPLCPPIRPPQLQPILCDSFCNNPIPWET